MVSSVWKYSEMAFSSFLCMSCVPQMKRTDDMPYPLTDFTPTKTAKSQGAPILPDGVKVLSYSIIGAEHRGQISHLIGTKEGRSKEKGEPITGTAAYAKETEYLRNL